MILTRRYLSPAGELVLGSFGDKLCMCDWNVYPRRERINARLCRMLGAGIANGSSEAIERAAAQLDAYFAGGMCQFDVPLLFAGTDFQQRVWHQLMTIPYGQTISYCELARSVGNPRAVRAVASANAANAISIFIPCHRVVASDGSLGGYAGGSAAKQLLLNLEGVNL